MTGRYGSKFVTCVLSGTEEGAIDVSAYQISEQGVGMVRSDMIEASVAPGIVRVKPSEGERNPGFIMVGAKIYYVRINRSVIILLYSGETDRD